MATLRMHPRFHRRLRAHAILTYGTLDGLFKRLPMSHGSITEQLRKGVLSERLVGALQVELGPDRWRFVSGEADVLVDSAPRQEAAA